MQRVLLTGGSGFVGSALIDALLDLRRDCAIRVLDLHPPTTNCVEYIQGDVLDSGVVEQAVQGCTAVVHLAAALGVEYTERNSTTVRRVNETGTWNVLNSAYRAKIEKLVFASSSEVYGNSELQPIPETALLAPRSVYAETKLKGEEFVAHFRELGARHWRVVRLFNLYGLRQRSEWVIPRFVEAVACNQAPLIYGPGTQVRSYCHVDDGVQYVIRALFTATNGEFIFNVGNSSEPISLTALADRVIGLSGQNVRPKFVPFTSSDRSEGREIWIRIPDTSRAIQRLEYRSAVSLDAGLKEMLRNAFAGRNSLIRSTMDR